jgi:hypothetical protein
MERGLIWLPLLALFIWLTWSGKNEYQKVEAYKVWAEKFDKSKYDIYAVLGRKGNLITWGKPTAKGIIEQSTFSLQQLKTIQLYVDSQLVNFNKLPTKGKVFLRFILATNEIVDIPFTEIKLAAQWRDYLNNFLE